MGMHVWVTYMRCNLLTLRAAWGGGGVYTPSGQLFFITQEPLGLY